MGQIRRRFIQTEALEARLAERAEELRAQANALAAGAKKEALLKLAQQAEMGAQMSEWLRSPKLQTTTQALERPTR